MTTPEPLNAAELADFHHLLTGEAVSLGRDLPDVFPGWRNVWAYQTSPGVWVRIPDYNTDATLFRDEVRPLMREHGWFYQSSEGVNGSVVWWIHPETYAQMPLAAETEVLDPAAEQSTAVALARRALKEAQR